MDKYPLRYRGKNPKQNTNKLSPATCKKYYTL